MQYPNNSFSLKDFSGIISKINIVFTLFISLAFASKNWWGPHFDYMLKYHDDLLTSLIVLFTFAFFFTLLAQLIFAISSDRLSIILGVIVTIVLFPILTHSKTCERIVGIKDKQSFTIQTTGWPVQTHDCENEFGFTGAFIADAVVIVLLMGQAEHLVTESYKIVKRFNPDKISEPEQMG
jgi:hypothetical protein